MSKGVLDYLIGSTSCLTACSCLIRMGDDGSGRPELTRTCNGMLHRAAVAACILFALEGPSVQLQQPVLEGVFMAIRAWYYSPFTFYLCSVPCTGSLTEVIE